MFRNLLETLRKILGKPPATAGDPASGPQDGADMPVGSEEIPVHSGSPAETAPGVIPVIDQPHIPGYLWCLDNGHGKATPGKRSPVFQNGNTLYEYELVRDINRRIMASLDAKGLKYFNVVPETEGDISLSDRVSRANNKASNLPKIYLSIHSNAFGKPGEWTSASGIETWYYESSGAGKKIASAFQRCLIQSTSWFDRGIRFHQPKAKAFFVLRNTSMPAVLTENGFYTNMTESGLLSGEEFRKKIADAHVNAILEIEKSGFQGLIVYPKNIGIKLL